MNNFLVDSSKIRKDNNHLAAILLATCAVAGLGFTPMLGAFASGASDHNLHGTVPIIKTRESTSTNWSGYAAEKSISSPTNGFVKSVKGTWTAPTLTCDSSKDTYSSVWVGIDGYSSSSVEQLGTEHDCVSGKQQDYAWFEMYPKPAYLITGMTIHSGDVLTASVTYTANNKFTLTMTDTTTGKSFTTTQRSNAARSSAEWIVEAPWSGGVLPLANFGTVSISKAQFTDSSGVTHTIDGRGSGTYDPITMDNPSGAQAIPSGISDSSGSSSFTVNYAKP